MTRRWSMRRPGGAVTPAKTTSAAAAHCRSSTSKMCIRDRLQSLLGTEPSTMSDVEAAQKNIEQGQAPGGEEQLSLIHIFIMIVRELTQRQQLRLLKLWLSLQFLSAEVMIKAQNSTFM